MHDNSKWLYISPLSSVDLIAEYEEVIGYSFPSEFKICVTYYNGAHPKNKVFLSFSGKRKRKRIFNNLFSFNKNDPSTIWKYNDWTGRMRDWNENGQMNGYVAFAKDPYGNLICFDKTNDKIVFIDHETLSIEVVADDFTEFVDSLKKN